MNIGTFSIILVAFSESGKKLTVFPLFSQPQSGSMQTPPHFLTCQKPSSFLWISNKLVPVSNPYIPANNYEHLQKYLWHYSES